jgi:redox-sensitive bicupin YhaK (pirin superfamily)
MNEDVVAPGRGFGEHPHDNMEIVTYVLSGALEHRDSMGNGEVLRPGEFQRMSAGTGITHSEFNSSKSEPVHLYQIWLFPERKGLEPSYEQRSFPGEGRLNALQLVASRGGDDRSLLIHADARIFLADLKDAGGVELELAEGRHCWVQVLRGAVGVNGIDLEAGDGAAISAERVVSIVGRGEGDVMVFDLL